MAHPPQIVTSAEWRYGDEVLVERYVYGRELTCGVMGGKVLGVTEIVPLGHSFYDYDAKYTDGLTTHVCPADIPAEVEAAALDIAVRAHVGLGCRGVSRSDFRWDPAQGVDGLYLLEVNTQPGMTPLSLVPEQARYRGLDYDGLVGRILEAAQ